MTLPAVGTLPPMHFPHRMAKLHAGLDGAGVDALLVTALPNIRYLTGFTGSAAVLLATGAGGGYLVTDGRYRTQAAEQLEAAGLGGTVELTVGGIAVQRQALAAAAGFAVHAAAGTRGRPRDLVGEASVGRGPGARRARGHHGCGGGAAAGERRRGARPHGTSRRHRRRRSG